MSGTVSNNISQSSGSITEPSGGVEIRSDDPTLSEGLMWYNTSANTLKGARTVSAWETVGALNTGVYANCGSGTTTAGLSFGGYTGSNTDETEEWNGTAWTDTSGNLASARRDHGSAGTQTATVAFGGGTNSSEEYNGTSWSSGGTLNESVSQTKGGGTLTAALRFGGET